MIDLSRTRIRAKSTLRGAAVVLLLLAAVSAAAADLDAGMRAHNRGDYAAALREFRPLAIQGDAAAQFVLGLMYASGEGVPQNLVRACAWSSGSGFVVGRGGEIAANHHVAEGCGRVTVSHPGGSYGARVLATDPDDDLALLQAPGPASGAATFSRSPRAGLGEAVTVAGFPLRGPLSGRLNVTSGNVSTLAGLGGDAKRLRITAPVQPGNSGGPQLDTAGNVVGVVVSSSMPSAPQS